MRRRFTTNKGFTEIFDDNKYLTIEALEDNLSLSFTNDIEYGIDGKGWIKLKSGYKTPSINIGQTLSFKGNLTPNSIYGIGTFTISKKCNLKGNIMSMLYGDSFEGQNDLSDKAYAFYNLFLNCTNIIDASELILPATTLAYYCYFKMFDGCTSLTSAPELPATTLVYSCYEFMFRDCTSLTTAPELPATTLVDYCYYYMFTNCSKLNKITMLATDISANNCLYNWVNGVASTGTFVKHPDMTTLPSGTSGIPNGWTVEDYVESNLITFRVIDEYYQGEEGMTWDQWLNSEYNTINAYDDNAGIYIDASRFLGMSLDGLYIISYQDGTSVLLDDIIINNHDYTYIPPPSTD